MIDDTLHVGVIGVGSMGKHHARVYAELRDTTLVGVADADPDRAREVAAEYGTTAVSSDRLLGSAEAVSIAVPDRYHYEIAREAIERGRHVLIEKPFVLEPARGRELIDLARERGVTLQVGHVERFNPVVQTLRNVVDGEEIIAIDADRLGPPRGRDLNDSPVFDLMVHDIDVARWLLGGGVESIAAAASGGDQYVTAILTFDGGQTARLTASRVTQRKVRRLSVTAADRLIDADYLDQRVDIHRRSIPEYVAQDGDVRFRHESVIERPTVDRGEPLKYELASFADAARSGTTPVVTGEDGLAVVEIAREVQSVLGEVTPLQEIA